MRSGWRPPRISARCRPPEPETVPLLDNHAFEFGRQLGRGQADVDRNALLAFKLALSDRLDPLNLVHPGLRVLERHREIDHSHRLQRSPLTRNRWGVEMTRQRPCSVGRPTLEPARLRAELAQDLFRHLDAQQVSHVLDLVEDGRHR